MPILDATFLVDLDSEPETYGPLAAQWAADEDLVVPVQAAIEFASGAKDPAEAWRKVRDAFTFLPLDGDVGLEAARLARRARQDGLFPGWPDIQIAAAARHMGMAVASRSTRHFGSLGVTVLSYAAKV